VFFSSFCCCLLKKTHTLYLWASFCTIVSSFFVVVLIQGCFFFSSHAPCSDPFFWFHPAEYLFAKGCLFRDADLEVGGNPSRFGIPPLVWISFFTIHHTPHTPFHQNWVFVSPFATFSPFFCMVKNWSLMSGFVVLCGVGMETEERNQKGCKGSEPEFFLQWGHRKRLRCVRVKDPRISTRLNGGIRRKLGSALDHRSGVTVAEKEASHNHHQQPNRLTRCLQYQYRLKIVFKFSPPFLFGSGWVSRRRCNFFWLNVMMLFFLKLGRGRARHQGEFSLFFFFFFFFHFPLVLFGFQKKKRGFWWNGMCWCFSFWVAENSQWMMRSSSQGTKIVLFSFMVTLPPEQVFDVENQVFLPYPDEISV